VLAFVMMQPQTEFNPLVFDELGIRTGSKPADFNNIGFRWHGM
jgi:hypothetical protein